MEYLLRFLIGGVVVYFVSAVAYVLKPKTLAGLFGAAPSVALATLALTIHKDGAAYAAIEARSMVAGATGFLVYAGCASELLMRRRYSALAVTSSLLAVWLAASFGVWLVWLR
jgi:hypothetical protein